MCYEHRVVIVDPNGNVIPANIVPFKIEGATTDPPTNVVPGKADFNGRICGWVANVNIMYYYQYSTDCSFNSSVSQTSPNNITTTGSCNQTVPPETVTNLAPGRYCYR